MKHHALLSACLIATLTTGVALAQTSTETKESPAATSSPVAYVYVQTSTGINVYDATAAGKLTLVKGSPFALTGLMSGNNGKYLIGVGTDDIHTYTIESNGAVGKQASEIDTQKYSGAACGDTDHQGATLDHTGKYLYVPLWGITNGTAFAECAALQTYKLASNGELTFLGDTESFDGQHQGAYPIGVATISSNDKLAYGVQGQPGATVYLAYKADSAGAQILNATFNVTGPTFNPAVEDGNYAPLNMAADPSSHLAVVVNEPFTNGPPPQLASFTINDSTGSITSTNKWTDMPTPAVYPGLLSMSVSGKLLAVGGAPGIQIFHFNGAAPITPYSGVLLPNVTVDQMTWDNNNHLYALSNQSGELYVLTVTPTSISEVSGSPYKVKASGGVIVVPK
jgi:hypothetical protein